MRRRILITSLSALLCAPIIGESAAQTRTDWVRRGDNIAVVFDASNSMKAVTDAPPGAAVTKRTIAVQTAQTVLDHLVATGVVRDITAVAFGNRYDIVPMRERPTERQQVCNLDIETILPRTRLTPQIAADTSTTIGELKPRGMTPISQSLALASTNLGPAGGSIVLITDWEDPCGAADLPPCVALERIAAERRRQNQGPVTLQVILVPLSRGFDARYVNALRACTRAEVVYLRTPSDIAREIPRLIPRPTGVAPPPPPPPEPAPPPAAAALAKSVHARIRVIPVARQLEGQDASSPIEFQILDASDRVVTRVALGRELQEIEAPAGSYSAKAHFPDGREILMTLGVLDAGSERDVYVAR